MHFRNLPHASLMRRWSTPMALVASWADDHVPTTAPSASISLIFLFCFFLAPVSMLALLFSLDVTQRRFDTSLFDRTESMWSTTCRLLGGGPMKAVATSRWTKYRLRLSTTQWYPSTSVPRVILLPRGISTNPFENTLISMPSTVSGRHSTPSTSAHGTKDHLEPFAV